MSVTWDADEQASAENASSVVSGDMSTDTDRARGLAEQLGTIHGTDSQENAEEPEEAPPSDGGGGGDTSSTGKRSEHSDSNQTKLESEANQSAHLRSRSEASAHSLSGLQIVSEFLDELINTVVHEAEAKVEFAEAESSIEEREMVQIETGDQESDKAKGSITTIKSIDDSYSIIIDEELQTQIASEREAAELQKRLEHERNIILFYELTKIRAQLKNVNNHLLTQMYELYRKEKMEHIIREMSLENGEMERKYVKLLLDYGHVRIEAQDEETKLRKQTHILEEKRNNLNMNLEEEFGSLLDKERNVGKGLIFSQTAKPIPDKMIEKLINKQVSKSKEVSKQRITYFKLRDAVSADENLLKSLQTLGENLTLMEYEQLKMQSQSCVEKLEERDADLHRLRTKATSAIQVLAEIREKAQALLEDLEAGKVILHDVNHQLSQTRERLGSEKKRRDMIRSDAARLRQEAGLLSEPKLLRDYKDSLAEKERLSEHLSGLKNKLELQKKTIAELRKSVAEMTRSNSLNN